MTETALAGAFIDGGVRHRILGVRLQRFSLWHLLLLQTLDSPFLRHGEVGLHDLRVAVGVCQLRFEQSKVRKPFIGPLTLWRLRRRCRAHAVHQPNCQRCAKDGMHREVLAFLTYTADFLHKPDYAVRPPAPSHQPKLSPGKAAPELIRLVCDIIAWSGWPEAHVWELPPGRAHWYQALALRNQGADLDFGASEKDEFNEAMKAAGKKPRGGKS